MADPVLIADYEIEEQEVDKEVEESDYDIETDIEGWPERAIQSRQKVGRRKKGTKRKMSVFNDDE